MKLTQRYLNLVVKLNMENKTDSQIGESKDVLEPRTPKGKRHSRAALWAGTFHAGYWLLTLYIHRKDVLLSETSFADIKPIPFNRLMLVRLMHFGMHVFCGLFVAFIAFVSSQVIVYEKPISISS
jgi:hypothetical protein